MLDIISNDASGQLSDSQGNPVTGSSPEALDLFNKAVRAFNVYRDDPVELCDRAIEIAPDFAMAYLLKAHLFALATEPEANSEAKSILTKIEDLTLNEREAAHLKAVRHVTTGEWTAAAGALDLLSMEMPRDLVALQTGHLMDFYRANARDLRDRIARALPEWSEDVPGYSFLLGMYSFGLEEAGDYAQAESVGKEATEREPLDCWSHHAVAHVLEMQGRAEDGLDWMQSREPHWSGNSNFFQVHNWWHKALYHLDLDQPTEALALFDGPIREGESGMALDLVDASALLWRLHLSGIDVGNRWDKVADLWSHHADGRLYPFNDLHAVMAYLGAGRMNDVDRILKAYGTPDTNEVGAWIAECGRPLVEGFAAFWKGDFDTAAHRLHAARFIVNRFGGSHAQRDVIDWTLAEAALRGNLGGFARSIAHERCALKPHSPVNAAFLRRAKALSAGK